MMTINEYKDKVIQLFKSGNATEEQWDELAEAILYHSENGCMVEVDKVINP